MKWTHEVDTEGDESWHRETRWGVVGVFLLRQRRHNRICVEISRPKMTALSWTDSELALPADMEVMPIVRALLAAWEKEIDDMEALYGD